MTTKTKKKIAAKHLSMDEVSQLTLPNLITRKEVADYLKVSVQSVINYTNRGLLASYKIGRRVLYNEAEVIAAIQSCAVKHNQHESTEIYILKKSV